MYWSYEFAKKKFTAEINNAWTVKEIIENTSSMGKKNFLYYAPTGAAYTYEETNLIANSIANSFISLGLKKGDRVGIYMTNIPEYIFVLFAIAKTGLIEVPINPSFRETEILHMVKSAQISTIVTEAKSKYLDILQNVSRQTEVMEKVIAAHADNELNNKSSSYEIYSLKEMIESSNQSNPGIEVDKEDDYAIFFTSGTTGMPKGAVISNKTFVLAAKSTAAFPVDSNSRNYTCLPLFHANAQLYSTAAMRALGASLVLSDRFSPKQLMADLAKYEVTHFNSIGGMMQMLDNAIKPHEVPEHKVNFVLVGGTPVELWERFEKKFNLEVYEGYSLSEIPVLFGNVHPDKEKRKIGSFGKPIFHDLGREVIVIDDNHQEVRVGTGELLQKGTDFITKGYWNATEATKETFEEGGWFKTGDVVQVDEEGYFFFVDRKKFMIRVAGENVSAFEVEAVVNSHPEVAQSVAIPVPDPIKEEEIKILIKLSDESKDADFQDIIKYCAEKLAYFKVPRYIEIVDDFPKTPTERIKKVELKEKEKNKSDHGWDRNKEIPDWKKRFSS